MYEVCVKYNDRGQWNTSGMSCKQCFSQKTFANWCISKNLYWSNFTNENNLSDWFQRNLEILKNWILKRK